MTHERRGFLKRSLGALLALIGVPLIKHKTATGQWGHAMTPLANNSPVLLPNVWGEAMIRDEARCCWYHVLPGRIGPAHVITDRQLRMKEKSMPTWFMDGITTETCGINDDGYKFWKLAMVQRNYDLHPCKTFKLGYHS